MFSQEGCTSDQDVWERSGKRGQRALELAELKMPVVPGFIFESRTVSKIEAMDVQSIAPAGLAHIEKGIGRKYGDAENPLLVKVVCSANLVLPIYPTVFNVGLSPVTIPGFAKMIGEASAWFDTAICCAPPASNSSTSNRRSSTRSKRSTSAPLKACNSAPTK